MLGGMFVLAVFAILLTWGINVSRRAPDRFSQLLAAGMTLTIFFYVAVNLMMVMGLAPVVGIPLPFMSHGGSSMMTIMICVARSWRSTAAATSGRPDLKYFKESPFPQAGNRYRKPSRRFGQALSRPECPFVAGVDA